MLERSAKPEIYEVTAATSLAERFMYAGKLAQYVLGLADDLSRLLDIVIPLTTPTNNGHKGAVVSQRTSARRDVISAEPASSVGDQPIVEQRVQRRSRQKFSDEKIIAMIESSPDLSIDEIAARNGISVATLYARKRILLPNRRTKRRATSGLPTIESLAAQNSALKKMLEEQGREIEKLKMMSEHGRSRHRPR